MANKYYSGQGTLYVGERDSSGRPKGLTSVGNVPTLEISIEIEKFEHKESETGNRSIDLTLIQELNGTFNAVLESISSANLALGFYGASALVAGATVAAASEDILIEAKETRYPLANINVDSGTTPTMEDSVAAPLVLDTDFSFDYENGIVTVLDAYAGTIPDTFSLGYDFLDHLQMSAFTVTNLERFLRFEGLNTVDDDNVVVDIFKASIDPAQNFGLINEEIASLTLTGNILQDTLNAGTGSEFFIERRIGVI